MDLPLLTLDVWLALNLSASCKNKKQDENVKIQIFNAYLISSIQKKMKKNEETDLTGKKFLRKLEFKTDLYIGEIAAG